MDLTALTHIDGTDLPTDAVGVKLAHHAASHHNGHRTAATAKVAADDTVPDREPVLPENKTVNPFWHGISSAFKPAMQGAGVLALFTLLFKGLEFLFESIAVLSALGPVAPIALSVVFTGAIWYGAKAFINSYQEAKEHNQSLAQRISRRFGFGHEREQEVETGPRASQKPITENLSPREQEIAKLGIISGIVGSQLGAIALTDPALAEELNQPTARRSGSIDKILDEGPRQYTADALARGPMTARSAEQIAERASDAQTALA